MDPSKPARVVKKAAERTARAAAEKASELLEPPVPGAPAAETPTLEEPTEPTDPLPTRSRTRGSRIRGAPPAPSPAATARAQQGAFLTTAHGHSAARHRPLPQGRCARPDAAAGPPPAREDHALRPRADPRARGARPRRRRARHLRRLRHRRRGEPGRVPGRGRRDAGLRALLDRSRFARLRRHRAGHPRLRHEVLHRRRASSTWSATTSRCSSSRTAIKFPDVIHAGKPHPDREIPQAQSAHDTFWDFVILHTEAQHHTMWNMSDRGIPRSYRTMEGFGVHTFRLTDAEGGTSLVEVPLEARAGCALAGVGGGPAARRSRPGLPPPGPLRRHRGRRVPAVGARHPGLPGHPGPDVRGDRPARPDQDRARGAGAGPGRSAG